MLTKYLLITILLNLQAFINLAYPWSYKEHATLSYEAYDLACNQLLNSFPLKKIDILNLCKKEIIYCYSHMVATAADYIENTESLIKTKYSKNNEIHDYILSDDEYFLFKKNNDCRNIENIILDYEVIGRLHELQHLSKESDIDLLNSKYYTKVSELFDNGLDSFTWIERNLIEADLAAQNMSHFHPDSIDFWETNINKMFTSKDRHTKFSYHAFSMHYLQDSFSAGHFGIDRTRYHQEYGNAYHDDINEIGYFVKSDFDDWNTYGDTHLTEPTVYILVNNVLGITPEEILIKIQQIINQKFAADYLQENIKFIKKLINQESKETISFSTPLDRNRNSPCTVLDTCRQKKLLFSTLKPDELKINKNCTIDRISEGIYIARCYETKYHVLRQSKRNIMLLLLSEINKSIVSYTDNNTPELITEINRKFPKKYKRLRQNDPIYLGKQPKILSFTEYKDIKSTSSPTTTEPPYGYNSLGIATSCDDKDSFGNTCNGLIFTKTTTDIPFPVHYYIKLTQDKDKDKDIYAKDISFTYNELIGERFNRNIAGIDFTVVAGIHNNENSSSYEFYCGAGLQLNFHFGRRVLFFEVDRLNSTCNESFDDLNTRFTIGLRFATIKLY